MRLLQVVWLLVVVTSILVVKECKAKGSKVAKNALVKQEAVKTQLMKNEEKNKKKKNKKKRKSPVVPSKKEKGGKGALGKGLVKQYKLVQSVMEASADLAKGTGNSINRAIKSWLSSDFEKLLLGLTAPDDFRPSTSTLREFQATINSFEIDEDLSPLNEDNPYRVCFRKLWSKMSEPDARTSLKALWLLHLLLKNAEGKDAALFQQLLKKMRRERINKKMKETYFSIEPLTDCTLDTQYLSDFIERYAEYVLKRGLLFTGSFSELQGVTKYQGMGGKDMAQVMFNAVKVLESALACALEENADEDCELVYTTALSLLAEDAKALFELYHDQLRWVVREEEIGELFDRSEWAKEEDLAAMLTMLKRFYTDTYPKLLAFLQDVKEVLSLYQPAGRGKKGRKRRQGDEDEAFALLCPPEFPSAPPPGPAGVWEEQVVEAGAVEVQTEAVVSEEPASAHGDNEKGSDK